MYGDRKRSGGDRTGDQEGELTVRGDELMSITSEHIDHGAVPSRCGA